MPPLLRVRLVGLQRELAASRTQDPRARRGHPGARSSAASKNAGVCSCSSAEQPQQNSGLSLSRRDALLGAVVTLTGAALAGGRAGPAWAAETVGDRAVMAAVTAAFEKAIPKSKAPAILRLAFHDAGTYDTASKTGGANASILFELDRPESFGLKRGLRPVQDAKELLKGTPAEGLSLADLIQLAGAHAVKITGGPAIPVPMGRRDASAADPPGRIPGEGLADLHRNSDPVRVTFDLPNNNEKPAEQLRARFMAAGFTVREMVALSGAHTIGGKGFGDPVTFDNTYFKTLMENPWAKKDATAEEREMMSHIGIATDKVMASDPECSPFIREYATDQAAFFRDFSAAYVKMGRQGVL